MPTMSAGMRSGVNCTRENFRFTASASVRTSIVLPSPGTPSSSTWPPAKKRHEHAFQDLLLADHHLAHLVPDAAEGGFKLLDPLGERRGFWGGVHSVGRMLWK